MTVSKVRVSSVYVQCMFSVCSVYVQYKFSVSSLNCRMFSHCSLIRSPLRLPTFEPSTPCHNDNHLNQTSSRTFKFKSASERTYNIGIDITSTFESSARKPGHKRHQHTHTCMHTCMHAHSCIIHTCVHTCNTPCVCVCVCVCASLCGSVCAYAYVRACVRTHTRSVRTHTHTYTSPGCTFKSQAYSYVAPRPHIACTCI